GCEGIGYMGNAVHLDTRGNGGYKNNHWYGDEILSRTVSDWHDYFAINEHFSDIGNSLIFEGGNIMNRAISPEQLKYEVNRYALTVLGREIGDADTYVELL
ncbi:MAG TPA: hypothetical protein DDX70_04310, partial [Bacteroides sp.]|nr:hypothetical protein [Bacteroides sp.]